MAIKNNPHHNRKRAEAYLHRQMAVHNFLVAVMYRLTPPDHPDYEKCQKAALYSLYEARDRLLEGRRAARAAEPVRLGAINITPVT